jgi:hypothetical protein
MKKLLLIFALLFFSVASSSAYETLFEADGTAPFSPTIGTALAIYDPNDVDR